MNSFAGGCCWALLLLLLQFLPFSDGVSIFLLEGQWFGVKFALFCGWLVWRVCGCSPRAQKWIAFCTYVLCWVYRFSCGWFINCGVVRIESENVRGGREIWSARFPSCMDGKSTVTCVHDLRCWRMLIIAIMIHDNLYCTAHGKSSSSFIERTNSLSLRKSNRKWLAGKCSWTRTKYPPVACKSCTNFANLVNMNGVASSLFLCHAQPMADVMGDDIRFYWALNTCNVWKYFVCIFYIAHFDVHRRGEQ